VTPIDRTSDGAPGTPAETARDEGDGFLARWSRRKRDVARAETNPPAAEPEPAPLADAETGDAEPETLSEEELAALPSVDDLTETSDLAPFLRRGVPTSLKNAAMRKIWMLTPAIRDYRDPAVDYAWDWNTPGGVPGDGCAPSVEETARMLRDLMAPREKPAEAATVASAPTPSPNASATSIEDAPDNSLTADSGLRDTMDAEAEDRIAQTEAPPTSTAGAVMEPVEKREKAAVAASSTPARRRHGGAFPS